VKTHLAKVIVRNDRTIFTSLCGRLNKNSRDGNNVTDVRAEVTCKHCLAKMQGGAA